MDWDPSNIDLIRRGKVKVSVPQGVQVPMCFRGDLCKLVKSEVLGDLYGRRFFMCDNYAYDQPKGIGGSVRPKVLTYPCDLLLYVLSLTQSDEDKAHVERTARWEGKGTNE
ncbi:hypothetical protein HU200_052895 [Digitaria exilis]|uniref:Uncharacterized protein n=1 Tax=Digitaria exilis TaxID=1010633 RepID=A0A835AMU9_9POAL|nr:hypothetical protein HU200_052895 [Digitaria exilis]